MPVTMEDVIRQLDREEPDYAQAANLGPEALPHLRQIIQGDSSGLASKAAYLAGFISGGESAAVLELAARHSDPVVRVAAAASARNLASVTTPLATMLLDDPDPGVRKLILRTLETHQPPGLAEKVRKMVNDDPEPWLREKARAVVDRMK